MKKLINILLFLLPLSIFAQTDPVEFTGIVTGKCNIAQTGSGSGYWQVSVTNYSSPRGTDCTELQVDDIVYFNDGGTSIALPITLVVSAVGNSATLRLNNTGITSIGSVPTTPAIISRGSANFKLSPWAANTSGNDNQMVNEYMCYLIDSLIANSGGNTIYTASDSVANNDQQVKIKNDSTFFIGYNDRNGFEDYWDNVSNDEKITGLFLSDNYWRGSGFIDAKYSKYYNSIESYYNGLNLVAQNDTANSQASIYLTSVPALNYSTILFGGRNRGTGYIYGMPFTTPSATNLTKSIMTWTGDGATATPAFETLSSAVSTIYTANDSIIGNERYIKMDASLSQDLWIGNFGTSPSVTYNANNQKYGFYCAPNNQGEVGMSFADGGSMGNIYVSFGTATLLGTSNNPWSLRSYHSINTDSSSAYIKGRKNGTEYQYSLVAANPSTTSSAKSEFLYTGTGSATTPSFLRKDYGNESDTTNGSGDVTVTCVMPDNSYVVNITPTGTTLGIGYSVQSKAAGSFVVRAFDTSTKAAITGTAVTFDWTLVDN